MCIVVPALNPRLQVKPFDTGRVTEKFIVNIGGKKRFEVSRLVYDILVLIDGKRNSEDIAQSLRHTTGLELSAPLVEQIVNEYFIPNHFIGGNGDDTEELEPKSYLRFRMSLLSQQSLRPLTRAFRFLFIKPVLALLAPVSIIIPFYIHFISGADLSAVGNVGGIELLAVYGIVFVTAFVHELGHSSACSSFGAVHGDIGIGLYLFFPVLYADVSDIWHLDRRQRIIVDVGGIYFQALCVPVLFLLYLVSGSTIMLCAIYATYLTILTALNPFLRFDGYWLLSDLFGVPNLRRRSMEAIKSVRLRPTKRRGENTSVLNRIDMKSRVALTAYGGLSVVFFSLFFLQVAYFLHLFLRNGASKWNELLGPATANPDNLSLAEIIGRFNSALPLLLIVVTMLISIITGVRYVAKRLVGIRQKSVSVRDKLQ